MTKPTVITSPEGARRPSKHAHKMVRETAVGMAGALYDTMMGENEWYAAWKAANPGASGEELFRRFLRKNLSKLLPQARATLAGMLATATDERLKEDIYDALLLDKTLIRGRNG